MSETMFRSLGAELIYNERERQVVVEGWTAEHDIEHDQGDLAGAGAGYALNAADQLNPHSQGDGDNAQPDFWPFEPGWWKPTTPLRDLVKAGALIAGEIDRLIRAGERVVEPSYDPIWPASVRAHWQPTISDAEVKRITERFLRWKLPANFNPDCGITFKAAHSEGTPYAGRHEPSGTNLFDYSQAETMVRFITTSEFDE